LAGGLAALALGGAAASSAMPAPVGSAQDVVNALQARGFHVIVNVVADAPLDTCAVTAVRPGSDVVVGVGAPLEKPLYTTVYVDVTC